MLHRCEELREITRRLAKVLPQSGDGSAVLDNGIGLAWSSHQTVIEAKPVSMRRLALEPKPWRLPPLHQDMLSRRAYIRQATSTQTEISAPVQDDPSLFLPPGMSLWHAPEAGRRLTVLALQDARMFFKKTVDWILTNIPSIQLTDEGPMRLFEAPEGQPELCFRDSVRILRIVAPYVARLAEEYAKSISWIYGLKPVDFEECCRLSVQWIPQGKGSPMELLPASSCRYENGPVVHVSVGRSLIYHDLAPTLADLTETDVGPMRLSVPEGVMVVLDGASRMRYSHGFPARLDDGSSWLNLVFMLDCTPQSIPLAYERETRAIIMRTPVVPERVVSTKIPANTGSSMSFPRDCMSLTLGLLRRQIRTAESHLMTQRCFERVVLDTGSRHEP